MTQPAHEPNGSPPSLEDILKTARDPETGAPLDVKIAEMPHFDLTAGEAAHLRSIIGKGDASLRQLGAIEVELSTLEKMAAQLRAKKDELITSLAADREAVAKHADALIVGRGVPLEEAKSWNLDLDAMRFTKVR